MPTFELTPALMREIIMDHYSNPLHKGVPTEEGYLKTHADSENCIDDFDLYLKLDDGKISDARWDGVACTISSASTDILCDLLIGRKEDEVHVLIAEFLKMIEEKPYDASLLEEALAFKNTGRQAARIHCATMGWTAADGLIRDGGQDDR